MHKEVRSLIFVRDSKLDCTLLPQFTNPDVCTVLMEKQNILLISVYMDILLKPVWPDLLDDAVLYATGRGFKVVIGTDSNAHSTLWGSPETNERGEAVEDACAAYGLHCCNTGNTVTYDGVNGQTIVDITLTNDHTLIQDWNVSDEVTLSDHRCVTYTINGVLKGEPIVYRSVKKVKWKDVADRLKSVIPEIIPSEWSKASLDEATEAFTNKLKEILDEVAPMKPNKQRKTYWWNEDCTKNKNLCMNASRINRRERTQESRKAFAKALRTYQKGIYKAKKSSWQSFIEEINSLPAAAKVNKILKNLNGPSVDLGLVQRMDGTLAEDKASSLRLMLQEHFPNSTPVPDEDKLVSQDTTTVQLQEYSWLNVNRLRAAIHDFKPGKSPGPDEVRVELLKECDDAMLKYIVTLFAASQTLGYVPLPWRYVTCVFLPKPGKSDYTERNSFRPVSLMSFTLKSHERMNLWRMEESALRENPLHPRQFGGRKGMGTDNALSTVVNTIEKGIMNDNYVLGLFIDIKKAFSSISYKAIVNALESRNVDPSTVAWYENFLRTRIVQSTLGSNTVECKCTCGCPQGGCLSSTLWSMAFDSFLTAPKNKAIRTHGFIDDGSLLITGPDPAMLYNLMNKAIVKATRWANSCGLKFCTKKTEAILFTYKDIPINKSTGLPFSLKMYGNEIPNVSSTKFLGVTLDKELTFREHINKRIKACRLALLRTRPIIGKNWSPKPVYMRWLYTSTIVSMMSHGCAVWVKALEDNEVRKKLGSLQRMGLLSIAPVRRGTPTASMEIMYDIPPLHILIKERAKMTYLRLGELHDDHWVASQQPKRTRGKMPKNPQVRKIRRGHLAHIRLDLPQLGDDDTMTPRPNFDRLYSVDTREELPETTDNTAVYTDGSRIEDQSGSGVYIMHENIPQIAFAERLPDHATVYQAELRAIQMTCSHYMWEEGMTINMHVDSLSALQAIKASHVKSRTVWDTVVMLNTLCHKNTVTLQKIRAHDPKATEDSGNEIADATARWGVRWPEHMMTDALIHKTRSSMKAWIKEAGKEEWGAHWNAQPELRQSKLFLHGPDPHIWRDLKKMKRKNVSNVLRFVTGHTFMKRHRTVIDKGKRGITADVDIGSQCRLCWTGPESPEHLLLKCPRLMWMRNSVYSQSGIVSYELDTPPPWSEQMVEFINKPIIQALDTSGENSIQIYIAQGA